jgi:hypothetical protein
MHRNEKSKKNTIERLRMILDNPYNKDTHINDEKYLNELREKLINPSKEDNIYIHRISDYDADSLKPKVKIHKKEEDDLNIPEFKQVETEPQIEEEIKDDSYENESLFEIEKIEKQLPEFLEVNSDDNKISFEEIHEEIKEGNNNIKKIENIHEDIPEWEPVEAKEIRFEEVKEDELESTKDLPKWKPIDNEKIKDKVENLQLEEDNEELSRLEHDPKINVFDDIKSIDYRIAELLYNNRITSIEILRNKSIKELSKIKGIKKKLAKKIKNELNEISVKFESVVTKESKDLDKNDISMKTNGSDLKINEIIFKYGEYGLYKKEIILGSGKKRTIRFFSKTKPDEGVPVDLPEEYEVIVNKKTGVPYIRKKN